MSKRLYIIGNGFDLHHGIPSFYHLFGEYLKGVDDDRVYRTMERYFSMDKQFWSEFEARLADFDSDTLIDDNSGFLNSYGAEDWRDSDHHNFQYEIDESVQAISVRMRAHFGDWIRSLPIPSHSMIDSLRLPLDPSARYLNFNYTDSLPRLYGIPDSQVLYIHGAASDPGAQLVLGHGREPPKDLDPYRFERDPEGADTRVIEAQQLIDGYFKDTFKPTAELIASSSGFFESLADVEEILVFGHSMSDVDHPYFLEVMRHVDMSTVKWTISYYGDVDPVMQQVEALCIPSARVRYVQLSELLKA